MWTKRPWRQTREVGGSSSPMTRGEKERNTRMVSFISFGWFPVPPMAPSFAFPVAHGVALAHVGWILLLALIASALGIVQQVETRWSLVCRAAPGIEGAHGLVRRRLPAVWCPPSDREVAHPLRRGVGGVTGRVPPRPAAGSTLPLRLAHSARARRR